MDNEKKVYLEPIEFESLMTVQSDNSAGRLKDSFTSS